MAKEGRNVLVPVDDADVRTLPAWREESAVLVARRSGISRAVEARSFRAWPERST